MNATIKQPKSQILIGILAQKQRLISIFVAIFGLAITEIISNPNFLVWIYLFIYTVVGYSVIFEALANLVKGDLFDENFLMSLASFGAILLGEYPEAVVVMLFYEIGELFEDSAVAQTKKSISTLLKAKTDCATLKTAYGTKYVSPQTINTGDLIIVKPGERIPLDGEIIAGSSFIDNSALTGESMPNAVSTGDNVFGGSINHSEVLEIKVTKPYQESTIARILELVENSSQKKAVTEKFIKRFSKVYTPVVVLLGLLLAIIPPVFFNGSWLEWTNRALIFLVISCPCALVISVPLSFFSGIGAASRFGILIKGSNYLEVLDRLDTVAFDKTGTLTVGKLKISAIESFSSLTPTQILAYTAAVEQYSTHPIAMSIVDAFDGDLAKFHVKQIIEQPGYGIRALVDGHQLIVGNLSNLINSQVEIAPVDEPNNNVYISFDGQYAGVIKISDQLKSDSKGTVEQLKQQGIGTTVVLTGDTYPVAKKIGARLGIDKVVANLLPEQKVTAFEKLLKSSHKRRKTVAFVGDGINDTPVLSIADVGIAMGGLGSDAAIETADVVIMDDQPSKLNVAINIAQRTQKIVWQNIIFALVVKASFLLLGALGFVGMWEAVFADVGVTILAVLNALRLQRFK